MKTISRLAVFIVSSVAIASVSSLAQAQTLALDFQPTGGTTAPGFQAFEVTNQSIPVAGTNYSAFGSTVTVSLATANLPDGALDFRAVARNGTANSLTNDWIGVDTRAAGMNVTLTVNFAGLPAGMYSWLSTHHDGAPHHGHAAPAISAGYRTTSSPLPMASGPAFSISVLNSTAIPYPHSRRGSAATASPR